VRELVAAEFDALLHDGQRAGPRRLPQLRPGPQPVDSEALLEQLPAELAERAPWATHPAVQACATRAACAWAA
jgi:glutamate-ammonia-ligase adenylyltransferase